VIFTEMSSETMLTASQNVDKTIFAW